VPDIEFAGYLANLKAGYRISGNGQISGLLKKELFGQQKVIADLRRYRYWL